MMFDVCFFLLRIRKPTIELLLHEVVMLFENDMVASRDVYHSVVYKLFTTKISGNLKAKCFVAFSCFSSLGM
jgi:hypothetical protein